MTGPFGEVFVMDWGIANTCLPQAGTPHYRCPEAGHTTLSDIFSLGRILEDFVPLPRPLAAITRRATAADPGRRYPTVQELAADVARFLDRLPVSAYRESPLEVAVRFTRRNHVLLLLLATYLVVKFALFFLFRR